MLNLQFNSRLTLSKISLYTARLVLNIGSGTQVGARTPVNSGRSPRKSVVGSIDSPVTPNVSPINEEKDNPESSENEMQFKSPDYYTAEYTEGAEDEDGSLIDSNKFLYGVFIACVAVQVIFTF